VFLNRLVDMNEKKPKLDANMNIQDLSEFYWMKAELHEFCRRLGLSTSGGKIEIHQRIEHFLRTGKRENLSTRPMDTSSSAPSPEGPFNMNTRVWGNFRCTREIRDFFEAVVDRRFHFSVVLQKFIKSNPGITFQQIADEWARLRTLKKSGKVYSIDSQFEYNQFTRDFFADPKNNGKTRKDCIEAWKEVRSMRGARKYKSKAK
jgi:SAP domain-containing new25/Domain of unknown function (DUF6434)